MGFDWAALDDLGSLRLDALGWAVLGGVGVEVAELLAQPAASRRAKAAISHRLRPNWVGPRSDMGSALAEIRKINLPANEIHRPANKANSVRPQMPEAAVVR